MPQLLTSWDRDGRATVQPTMGFNVTVRKADDPGAMMVSGWIMKESFDSVSGHRHDESRGANILRIDILKDERARRRAAG